MSRKIVTELTTPRERLGKRKGYLQEVLIRSVTEVTTFKASYTLVANTKRDVSNIRTN